MKSGMLNAFHWQNGIQYRACIKFISRCLKKLQSIILPWYTKCHNKRMLGRLWLAFLLNSKDRQLFTTLERAHLDLPKTYVMTHIFTLVCKSRFIGVQYGELQQKIALMETCINSYTNHRGFIGKVLKKYYYYVEHSSQSI